MTTATLTKRPLPHRAKALRQLQKPSLPVAKTTTARQLRQHFDLARPIFARLMGCSERALANWEAGRTIPEIYQSRLNELKKLYEELSEVAEAEKIGAWFIAPNEEFGGLKPIELIERGEMFRIWRMIFFLKSGMPA